VLAKQPLRRSMRRRATRCSPVLEALEARVVLSKDFLWVGPQEGDWDAATNWATPNLFLTGLGAPGADGVPGADDTAYIGIYPSPVPLRGTTGAVTIHLPASASIAELTTEEEGPSDPKTVLTLTGGELTCGTTSADDQFGDPWTLRGKAHVVVQNGGVLDVDVTDGADLEFLGAGAGARTLIVSGGSVEAGPRSVTAPAAAINTVLVRPGGRFGAGSITAKQVLVARDGDGPGVLDLSFVNGDVNAVNGDVSAVHGDVMNNGEVDATHSHVDGSFVQTASGVMSLTPDVALLYHVFKAGLNGQTFTVDQEGKVPSALDVRDTLTLAGRLDTPHSLLKAVKDPSLLAPRFVFWSLLRYGSLAGRFDQFTGSVVTYQPALDSKHHNSADRFWALDYEATYMDQTLVETPRLLQSGSWADGSEPQYGRFAIPDTGPATVPSHHANLALIAPGSASTVENWITGSDTRFGTPTAPVLPELARHTGSPNNWDFAALEWKEFDTGNDADIANPKWKPYTAATLGINIGESLAFWLKQVGLDYQGYHIISHSSGSWLADAVTTELKALAAAAKQRIYVQETLFDAFDPYEGTSVFTVWFTQHHFGESDIERFGAARPKLGEHADYADQFYDNRWMVLTSDAPYSIHVPYFALPAVSMTDNQLQFCVNINVTEMDTDGLLPLWKALVGYNAYANQVALYPQRSHAWPWIFYERSASRAQIGGDAAYLEGFGRSAEWSGTRPTYDAQHGQGGLITLHANAAPDYQLLADVYPLAATSVVTGTGVSINPADGVDYDFKTAPDAASAVTSRVNVEAASNLLKLVLAMPASLSGAVKIAVDGIAIATLDSRIFGGIRDGVPVLPLLLPIGRTLAAGLHDLSIEVDPAGAVAQRATIGSIEFGYAAELDTGGTPNPGPNPQPQPQPQPPATVAAVAATYVSRAAGAPIAIVIAFNGPVAADASAFVLLDAKGRKVRFKLAISVANGVTAVTLTTPKSAPKKLRLQILGDRMTSSNGAKVDADGDGAAGGTRNVALTATKPPLKPKKVKGHRAGTK
jgi:hypothetical protein